MRGQIVCEGDISVGPLAEQDAVQPDLGIHVNAVEDDLDAGVRAKRRQFEALAIPADATDGEAGGRAAGAAGIAQIVVQSGIERADEAGHVLRRHLLPQGGAIDRAKHRIEGWIASRTVLNAPVMRQLDPAPCRIVIGGLRNVRAVAEQEAPSIVENLAPTVERQRGGR